MVREKFWDTSWARRPLELAGLCDVKRRKALRGHVHLGGRPTRGRATHSVAVKHGHNPNLLAGPAGSCAKGPSQRGEACGIREAADEVSELDKAWALRMREASRNLDEEISRRGSAVLADHERVLCAGEGSGTDGGCGGGDHEEGPEVSILKRNLKVIWREMGKMNFKEEDEFDLGLKIVCIFERHLKEYGTANGRGPDEIFGQVPRVNKPWHKSLGRKGTGYWRKGEDQRQPGAAEAPPDELESEESGDLATDSESTGQPGWTESDGPYPPRVSAQMLQAHQPPHEQQRGGTAELRKKVAADDAGGHVLFPCRSGCAEGGSTSGACEDGCFGTTLEEVPLGSTEEMEKEAAAGDACEWSCTPGDDRAAADGEAARKAEEEAAAGIACEWSCTPGEHGSAAGEEAPKEDPGDIALILDDFQDRLRQRMQQALDGRLRDHIRDEEAASAHVPGARATAGAGPC